MQPHLNRSKGVTNKSSVIFITQEWTTVDIEKQGISPLQPELDKINSINNKTDLLKTAANLIKGRHGFNV